MSAVEQPGSLETLGGLQGSPETHSAGNNSEVSVNKKAGNFAKFGYKSLSIAYKYNK